MKRLVSSLILAGALLGAATASGQGRTGASSPGQTAFNEGMNALNSDDYAAAQRRFADAIRLDGSIIDAYWRLASVYYRNRQYADAVALLRRAPDPTNLEVKQQLALSLYKTATPPPAEAVALLEEVTQARPELFAAQLQLGQHLVKLEPRRAATALELYLKHRPADAGAIDAEVRQLLGSAYLYARDWELAAQQFDQLLGKRGDDVMARLMLAAALTGKGDAAACNRAIPVLERLKVDAPRQPSVSFNLGSCLLKVNRAVDAEREAQLYVKARPADIRAHLLLGDALLASRQVDRALAAYQGAQAVERSSPTVAAKMGLAELERGAAVAAIELLERALPAVGEKRVESPVGAQVAFWPPTLDVDVLCGLVRAYSRRGITDRLLVQAERLAALREPRPLYCAANGFFAAGQSVRSAEVLDELLRLDAASVPGRSLYVKVLNRLALDAVDRQELERARETLGRALTLLPEEAMSLRNLAVVLLMQRKEAEALDALARLSRQNARPDLSLARLRARASLGVGKRDEARAELEQALPLAQKLKGVEFAAFSAELGALLSDAGQHDQAVALLEQGFKESGVNPVADSLRHNLAEALVARARQRAVEGKQLEGAADDLKRALGPLDPGLAPRQTAPATCLLGTVELQLGRFSDAVETFRRAQVGGGCSMAPPYDRLGAPFFQAYAAYRESGNLKGRDESVRQLVTLLAKSSGATQELLRRLVRSAYEQLGYDYFLKSDERRAESSLRAAQRVPGSGEHRELDHNVAVLDLLAGRTAQAEKVLDGLAGRPLESWVNLGIVRERQGEVREALQLYRRAFDKGLKLPKLRDWIEVKERLFGGAP